jgi:hypothetical protein
VRKCPLCTILVQRVVNGLRQGTSIFSDNGIQFGSCRFLVVVLVVASCWFVDLPDVAI